jgi:hypothetical protein
VLRGGRRGLRRLETRLGAPGRAKAGVVKVIQRAPGAWSCWCHGWEEKLGGDRQSKKA